MDPGISFVSGSSSVWQKLSGQQAVLESTGSSFEETTKERANPLQLSEVVCEADAVEQSAEVVAETFPIEQVTEVVCEPKSLEPTESVCEAEPADELTATETIELFTPTEAV